MEGARRPYQVVWAAGAGGAGQAMVPRDGEWTPGDDAGRPEQHIAREPVIWFVLRRKIPAHPIVHHAEILTSPVPIRRIRPAVGQVEEPRERYDIRDQTFDFHSLVGCRFEPGNRRSAVIRSQRTRVFHLRSALDL